MEPRTVIAGVSGFDDYPNFPLPNKTRRTHYGLAGTNSQHSRTGKPIDTLGIKLQILRLFHYLFQATKLIMLVPLNLTFYLTEEHDDGK